MRPFLARFSEPVWLGNLASWADFITATSELEFSVHTLRKTVCRSRKYFIECSRLALSVPTKSSVTAQLFLRSIRQARNATYSYEALRIDARELAPSRSLCRTRDVP